MTSDTQSNSGSGRSIQSLETKIGLYWLHKLGIVSLVFGVAFLIMSSFQYFGKELKLLTGFVVSAVLILLGRQMGSKEKSQWFAHGLTAGGWSLAYFTTYAAHFLPWVQVIDSLTVESLLLLLVAGGSLGSSLRARSEVMSIYSVTLAAASIILSGPGLFADISFVIIAITSSILGNIFGWRKLFAYGMAACYAGHLYCSSSAESLYQCNIASAAQAAIWLVFSVGSGYMIHLNQKERTFNTILSVLNALAFLGGMTFFSGKIGSITHQLLFAMAGSVYLGAARWLHKRDEEQLRDVHTLLGLSFINFAKVSHFSGQNLLTVDLIEIAILAAIGAKNKLLIFRGFAIFLSIALIGLLFGSMISFSSQIGFGFYAFSYVKFAFAAVIMLGSIAALHIRKGDEWGLSSFYGWFYYSMANLVSMLTIFNIIDHSWTAFALIVQCAANHLLALKLKNDLYTILGFFCALIAIGLMSPLTDWNTSATALTVAVLYATHFGCRYFRNKGQANLSGLEKEEGMAYFLQILYAFAANITLTIFIFKQVQSDYISTALGIEGIVVLLLGFILRDQIFRLTGLTILAILAGKLFLFDFAKFNTFERVCSFTVAGLVFLLSSYGYARFTRSFEDVFPIEPAEGADPEAAANTLALTVEPIDTITVQLDVAANALDAVADPIASAIDELGASTDTATVQCPAQS